MLFSADFQLGDNTFNTFYGLSMKGFNLVDNSILGLNAHLDAWSQPELANYTMPSSIKKMGGAFKVDLMLRPFNQK